MDDDAEARAEYGAVAMHTLDCVDAELVDAIGDFSDDARDLMALARAKGIDREQAAGMVAAAVAGVAAER